MDTSGWKRETLDLRTGVRLDPKNVRLETMNAKVEADIIEDLFTNERALSLVEGICSLGYLTHETPIVVRRGTDSIVVEGNRRIAALKAIQNPKLVPNFSHRIEALLRQYPGHPKIGKVEVLRAPSQDVADQLIAAIHTGNLRRRWTPSRQAAFFQAQIDAGRTYDELVKRYPTSDVKKFTFRAHMINRFKKANYVALELKDYVNSPKFKTALSTLARIYDSKEFRDLTGLTMQADGGIKMSVKDAAFDAIAGVIVRDLNDGGLNTRTLNTVRNNPRFELLMNQLRDAAGVESTSASTKTDPKPSVGPKEPSPAPSTTPAVQPATTYKPPKAPKREWLLLTGVSVPGSYGEGFKQTLQELTGTDVRARPMTAFLLMRATVEKGIKSFAEGKSIEIRKTDNIGGYVYLSHCLDWLKEYANKNGDRSMVQVISNMNKLVTYEVSKNKLDAVNHNHRLPVTAEEAAAMWTSVRQVIEYVVKP